MRWLLANLLLLLIACLWLLQTDYMVGMTTGYGGAPQTVTRLTMALMEETGWWVGR
jgi:hypothetical protein